jgi:hypothetical protein
MPQEISIIDVREIPSTDPARAGKLDIIVTYQSDPLHTFITIMPKEAFTEENLKKQIQKEMAERAQWIGKKITLA